MPPLQIIEYPDPRLRLHAEPVADFDTAIEQLVADLFETLYSSEAIGLCAPQADVQKQILVMDLTEDASAPEVYINPEILQTAVPGIVEESCLSLPGVVANLFRPTRVRVRARDASGEPFERDLEGMHAVCLQHEMDHFVGKLLVDRVWFYRRWRIRAAARAKAKAAGQGARISGL